MADSKYAIRMSTRGRITLPAELRRSLGIRGGERAYWKTLANGDLELVIQPNLAA
jgi:bifunctional DNA-binding transcriptional regulator/antitoxin component of YhaV-PrlF toxin-antitoxin module